MNSFVVLAPGYPAKGEIVAYSNALVNGQLTKERSWARPISTCPLWYRYGSSGKNFAFSYICSQLAPKAKMTRKSSPFGGPLSESRHMMQQNCLSQANKPDMLHPRFLCFVV
jgi:hypothetical protein